MSKEVNHHTNSLPEDVPFPTIQLIVEGEESRQQVMAYQTFVEESLRRLVPKGNIESVSPLVELSIPTDTQKGCSFFFLSRYRSDSFKFFFEIVCRWLIPGRRLNVVFIHASDFKIPDRSDQIYTICEVRVRLDQPKELADIEKNWPILQSEILLGLESAFYARKIQEVRGLSNDEKTALIQERIAYLMKRRPKFFQPDIFSEMQHLLVICKDAFKFKRTVQTLTRIIIGNYIFYKELKRAGSKRKVAVKVHRTRLVSGESVLSILVAVNSLQDKEVLEESHLLNAIRKFLPHITSVSDSFFIHRRSSEKICHLYLEIEKKDRSKITSVEMKLLRKELPSEIEGRIEHLMSLIFMPRNEEEVMRQILELSKQLKYVRDIPQCYISFERQTHSHLYFTVIVMRVLKPGTPSIDVQARQVSGNFEIIPDFTRRVGFLRKKYAKEATVLRLKLPKDQFLRVDHSINLYRARFQAVVILTQVIGEFRDYNGGMIFKQSQLLTCVRELLEQSVKFNELLLETFFYSLKPTIMRSVLEPEAIKMLFVMLQNAISGQFFEEGGRPHQIRTDQQFIYAIVITEDNEEEMRLRNEIKKLNIDATSLAYSTVNNYGTFYTAFLYRTENPDEQEAFCRLLAANLHDLCYTLD